MARLTDLIAVAICRVFHPITIPQGASYQCLVCQRKYAVSWAAKVEPGVYSR